MKLEHKAWGNIYAEKRVAVRPGLERVTVTYNDETQLCYFFIKKGSFLETHQHPALQNGIVIKGKAKFTKDDGEHILGPGDGYLFDGNERHALETLEDTELIECFTPARDEYKVEREER